MPLCLSPIMKLRNSFQSWVLGMTKSILVLMIAFYVGMKEINKNLVMCVGFQGVRHPKLVMIREWILSSIIPGEKGPGNDIDIMITKQMVLA